MVFSFFRGSIHRVLVFRPLGRLFSGSTWAGVPQVGLCGGAAGELKDVRSVREMRGMSGMERLSKTIPPVSFKGT